MSEPALTTDADVESTRTLPIQSPPPRHRSARNLAITVGLALYAVAGIAWTAICFAGR